MKYKKKSIKKKRQQQHCFSKKYAAATVQRGGRFDAIPELNIMMEGQTNTCMAVHSTEPLVVVGDDAGTVTLFEMGQAQPKKLAQLTGLPTAVKCVEFHPTLLLVAAACSDRVLMWKLDQINREQQEGVVQQFQPVSVFGLRSKEEIETEKTKMENTILRANEIKDARDELEKLQKKKEENELKIKELNELEIRLNLKGINIFSIELKIKALERELDAREVSCIAFRPFRSSVNLPSYISYIAVGVNVNNEKNKQENKIIMCRFEFDTSSVEKLYEFSPILKGEPIPKVYPDVSLMSFSHNGAYFAFVTQSSDGTFLKVMNFEVSFSTNDRDIYKIDQRATSIMSYRSPHYIGGYQHQFIIGCDNGSLLMTQATTINVQGFSTKIRNLNSIREWNARGGPIKCVAVHPSLPLVASGTRGVVTLWDINEPDALKSFALQDVISVGFNQNFLAVCGPRSMRFYSCNPDDYREESKSGEEIKLFVTNVTLGNRRGECSICGDSMNDTSTQKVLRYGPEDAIEQQLACGHTFHKKCIQPWIKQGKPCPLCRKEVVFVKATPPRILTQRIKEMEKRMTNTTIGDNERRFISALGKGPIAQGSPIGLLKARNQGNQPTPGSFPHHQGSPLGLIQDRNQGNQPMPGSSLQRNLFPDLDPGQKGGSKNKYSRKKNSSKKSKIRHRYSRKK